MKNAKKFTLCKHLPAFLLVCFFALSALIFGEGFAIRSAAADGYVYDIKGRTVSFLDTDYAPSKTITFKDSVGGGIIQRLDIHSDIRVTLESGELGKVTVYGHGIFNINGGTVGSIETWGQEQSTLTINGGTINCDIEASTNSVLLNNGTINGHVASPSFVMNGGVINTPDFGSITSGNYSVSSHNFVMNGGTIRFPNGRAIILSGGSNVIINGGTIEAATAIGTYRSSGQQGGWNGGRNVSDTVNTLTINGGTIKGGTSKTAYDKLATTDAAYFLPGAALELDGLSDLTIKGGYIQGSVYMSHMEKLSIDKATFTNTLWLGYNSLEGSNKSVTILGGNFQNGLDIFAQSGNSTILIKNGIFSSTDDEALSIKSTATGHNTVTIENGTFSSVNRPAVQSSSYKDSISGLTGSNTVTIENGTFKSTESNSVDIDENSTFTVKDGTFTGTLYCVASSTASTSPLKLFGGTFYPAKSTEEAEISLRTNGSNLDILSTLASGYCFKLAGNSNDFLQKDVVKSSSIQVQSGQQQFRLAFKDPDYMEGAKVYSDTKFVTEGSSLSSLPTPPARTGYTFKGWTYFGDPNLEIVTSSSIFHWKTSKGDYHNYHIVRDSNVGAIWLSAVWQKTSTTPTPTPTPSTGTTYKVSFNANGGKKVASTKKLKTGQVYGALPKTSRKGYTFLGWYTAKTKGTKVTAKTKFTRKSNLTLYAHWKYTTYKITYKTQKGKLSGKYKKTYQMITKTFKLPTPKRTGYTFRGWSTSASKFKKVTQIKKGTTGNKTFYAWWKKATAAPTLSSVLENMVPGQTITLTTTGTITSQITWKSSDSSVATVKNGIVIAKKAGTAIITMNCMNFSKTCIIKVSSKTSTPSKATTYKAPGLNKKYVVGVDIPAGEYYMKPTRSYDTEIVIYKNGKTKSFYDQDTYGDSAIITLSKGTSVSYKGLTAVPIGQSKKLASTKKEGMFKVGFHIPAGTYTLKSREGFDEGYYYIYNSSKPNADYDIESFTGTTTITLKKGQYLKLSFATIVQ